MAVSDDDIIKRRLLIDGEGGNDDKRLNNLLRTFVRWCSSPEDEDSDMTCHRMMATLAQCEFVMEKSLLVSEMNLKEQENYEKLSRDIADKIQQAATNIAECKQELQQAKRIRKNRQEYDALAKIIQQHPDRQETTKQLQALDKELTSLAETKESLEGKLDLRRKQFLVLITAIHELQRILEEDEKESMET